jgi:HlyD family secretion protein
VVSAKIQGRLAELRVEEGSRVKQGELLARLESSDTEANVVRAKAGVQRAEADAAEAVRQEGVADKLAGEQIVSTDQRDAARSRTRVAQAGVAQARAELALAQASLDNTRIVAPFSGTVVKKMAEVGESVAPIPPGVNLSTSSGAVVALADLDTLELEADVSEANVAKLSADQPAEVVVEAVPDRTYRAVLRQVIPTADRTKATVQVKVTLLEKDDRLRPEMSARVTFLEPARPATQAAPSTPVVLAPADAIATRDGKSVVFEVIEGRVRRREVQKGASRQGQVEIRSGLSGGEQLVVQPADDLQDGQRVRVSQES